jgi:DNA repair protein RadD
VKLRSYQASTADWLWDKATVSDKNPVAPLPTGTGKSLIVAEIIQRALKSARTPTLVLCPSKELIIQNKKVLFSYFPESEIDTGTLCAGLDSYCTDKQVTFATPQSVLNQVKKSKCKDYKIIIVDEAHTVPYGEKGVVYSQIFYANYSAVRIGLTATPWRTDNGLLHKGEGSWFDILKEPIPYSEFVESNWLSPLEGYSPELQMDTQGLSVNGGDFSQVQAAQRFNGMPLERTIKHALSATQKRKHLAVYCPTISAANKANQLFSDSGEKSEVLTGETRDREEVLKRWKTGETRILCSVEILTTGLDFPALDAIVCFRPTLSSSLWVQIMGRGSRLSPEKKNCLVLDYAGNLERLGGVDIIENYWTDYSGGMCSKPAVPAKVSRSNSLSLSVRDPNAGTVNAVKCTVQTVAYIIIPSKRYPSKKILLVSYQAFTEEGFVLRANDFVCCEYSGAARKRAEDWFNRRGENFCPNNVYSARARVRSLPVARTLLVRRRGKDFTVDSEFL